MTNKIDYIPLLFNGNGVTTNFAFNFKALDKNDIIVSVISNEVETLKNLEQDYTVTLHQTGGEVVFKTAPEIDTVIILKRNTRFGANPKWRNTAEILVGNELSPTYISEKERFNLDRNVGKDDLSFFRK